MNINKNGCQSTPSLNQILAIILFIANAVFTFIQVIILNEKIQLIILSVLVMLSFIFALLTTLSVPTDLSVIKQMQFKIKGSKLIRQAFDYEQQQLDQFCETCEAYVMTNTKHCKQCNRCCQEFDHHCKWINNCIGGLNYRKFVGMIATTNLLFIYSLIIHCRVVNEYTTNRQQFETKDKTQQIYNNDKGILITSIILIPINSIVILALTQLIGFHIFLKYYNITTYEYLINGKPNKIQPIKKDLTIRQDQSQIDMRQDENQQLQIDQKAVSVVHTVHSDKNIKLQQTGRMKTLEISHNNDNQIVQFYSSRANRDIHQNERRETEHIVILAQVV